MLRSPPAIRPTSYDGRRRSVATSSAVVALHQENDQVGFEPTDRPRPAAEHIQPLPPRCQTTIELRRRERPPNLDQPSFHDPSNNNPHPPILPPPDLRSPSPRRRVDRRWLPTTITMAAEVCADLEGRCPLTRAQMQGRRRTSKGGNPSAIFLRPRRLRASPSYSS